MYVSIQNVKFKQNICLLQFQNSVSLLITYWCWKSTLYSIHRNLIIFFLIFRIYILIVAVVVYLLKSRMIIDRLSQCWFLRQLRGWQLFFFSFWTLVHYLKRWFYIFYQLLKRLASNFSLGAVHGDFLPFIQVNI